MITLIFFSLIKASFSWIIILYAGTNLVGYVGRGFWEESKSAEYYSQKEIDEDNKGNNRVTVFFIFITVGFCFYLFHSWGSLFLLALLLIMLSRIPILYWEIRILPKELEMPYPISKELIRKAIKAKNNTMPIGNALTAPLIGVAFLVLFAAFYLR